MHPTVPSAPPPQHNLDLALDDSDTRFIASRLVATVAPIAAVDTQADQLTDQESLADSSDDDDDEPMSPDDDETRVGLGVATRRPSIGTTPSRPASLLGVHGATQPAQTTPLSEAQSTTAAAPLPPLGLDPRAHVPMRAHEDCAGSSGDMGPHTQAPTLVRLTPDDDSSPLGPPGTHTGTRVAPPAPPMEHQRQHTSPPPVAPTRDSADGESGAAPRALLPASPRLSASDIAQQWTATAGPARPAVPLASQGARPEQVAPLRAARLDAAPAPLAPVLDPGAHSPTRARGGDSGNSGGLDSQALAPALLRLATSDAPSPPAPPGLFGTSAGAHSPPPSPPVAPQRRHTAPPPIVSPITAFLLHARQQAAGGAVDPIPGAPAPAGVPRLPLLANSATDDTTADASFVTATRKRKARGSHQAADEATVMAASAAVVRAVSLSPDGTEDDRGASGSADAIPASAAPIPVATNISSKKRRRSGGPARAAREAAFAASKSHSTIERHADLDEGGCERQRREECMTGI